MLYLSSFLVPTSCPNLSPYTTLFRSDIGDAGDDDHAERQRVAEMRVVQHVAADLRVEEDRHDVERRSGERVGGRSEEHTSELQSPCNLVCRLLLEKKKLFHQAYS